MEDEKSVVEETTEEVAETAEKTVEGAMSIFNNLNLPTFDNK